MSLTKKTKIVATLGPATQSERIIRKMIQAGVDVFRVNFSHADRDELQKNLSIIRKVGEELDMSPGILFDLQGPKLRIGKMKEEVAINPGDELCFCMGEPFEGTAKKVYMNYHRFALDVKPGERILVDDGNLIFEVVSANGKDEVKARVIQGGVLKSRKGVNLPNTDVSLPALTEKDVEDALFAIEMEADWIALSFVRSGDDLKQLNELIAGHAPYKIPVIAKIEKPEAVQNIDSIVPNCDGFMVARGDLGVEIPAEEVPLIQKELVLTAKNARIPVIIATQMMESMIHSLRPTRAEVNDVANSVMDGTDAVMLSAETAIGKHPVEVVETMARVLKRVEDSPNIRVPQEPPTIKTDRYMTKSVCYHAALMANEIEAKGICTLTNSGYTAFQISAWRPDAYILVFTSNKFILNRLNLLWGVKAFYYDKYVSTDETIEDVNRIAQEKGFVRQGDFLVNLAAMPIAEKGMVNTLRVSQIR